MTARGEGIGRFAADLPPVDQWVSLGEGDTPLLALPAVAERLGLPALSAKMESCNPTGSYKDRVAAMSLSLALMRGNRGWIATSSGNGGLAMAAFGARAAVPGFLCMVASAPMEKRLPLMPYPVGVVALEGVGRDAVGTTESGVFEQVRRAARKHDLYLAITAHAFNPAGMRGIDTIAYELAEQAPQTTHVYVPTGGGGLLTALARGIAHRGLPAKVVACQPSGCAPITRFLNGALAAPEIDRCDSGISALQLPHPPDGQRAADAVTRSGGWGTEASDTAILAAQRLLAETEGVFVEPASAAGLAALIGDVELGRLDSSSRPVLVLTGAGWKDLGRFSSDTHRLPTIPLSEIAERVDNWVLALNGPQARISAGRDQDT